MPTPFHRSAYAVGESSAQLPLTLESRPRPAGYRPFEMKEIYASRGIKNEAFEQPRRSCPWSLFRHNAKNSIAQEERLAT